jgi:hypothetical protein
MRGQQGLYRGGCRRPPWRIGPTAVAAVATATTKAHDGKLPRDPHPGLDRCR